MLEKSDTSSLVRKNAAKIVTDELSDGWGGQSMEFGNVYMFTIQG